MVIQEKSLKSKNQIVIPLGDPAGIGTEITLKALGSYDLPKNMHPLLIGCKRNIELSYQKLIVQGKVHIANPKDLDIEDLPFQGHLQAGCPSKDTGEASFIWLTRAIEIIKQRQARALVTAPIAKHAWHKAGHLYQGQTERLAIMTSVKNPSMLFTAISPINGWRLNTLLATTHIPLKDIHQKLTPQLIIEKLNTLLEFCQKFKALPKLSIAGLNPHSGEEGRLGKEEINWLIPVIKEWKEAHPGITLEGPVPPDTCWISSAKSWTGKENYNAPDGILALYHDQGLIPVKLIAFDSAVNTTLGLPFIRTSPDHGTAFDIAGKGIASHQSMLAAIKTAWQFSDS